MKLSIIEILFEVIRKITVPSKELLPQQAGELLYGSMGSPIAKQLCRLAAEIEQEAEDKKIPFCLDSSASPEVVELWFRRMIVRLWLNTICGIRRAIGQRVNYSSGKISLSG